ncbi:MAG: hypothetical protein KAS96_01865 [Planctomycetes bacterium]|nr:hypothetical protein [Planctomycetota bacterium]
MKRPSKRMALYEVMGKKESKSFLKKSLEPLKPTEKEKKVIPPISSLPEKSSEKPVKWANKPKFLQLNAGRVEMSIPYQVAIAVILVAFVVVLMAFRFGKASGNQNAAVKAAAPVKKIAEKPVYRPVSKPKVESSDLPIGLAAKESAPKPVLPAVSTGGSNIVVQTLRSRNDLEPVKDYFAGHGIATEIKKVKSWYYLVTVNKYESLKKTGSQGNNMLKRIVELGAGYKAPQGFESFRVKGKTPFRDAYGIKFED